MKVELEDLSNNNNSNNNNIELEDLSNNNNRNGLKTMARNGLRTMATQIEPFNGPRVEKLKIEVITIEMG